MPSDPQKLFRFWEELKRRKVMRVITVYAAAAFVILELVSIIVEPLRLPEWTLTMVIILLCAGFILAVILSWIFDITPEGVQKTAAIPGDLDVKAEKPSQLKAWKITSYVSIAVIIGLVLFHLFGNERNIDWKDLERTIAVLPFENLGTEELSNALNNTLPIALITELQNIEGFSVKPWLSTKNYGDSDQRSAEIGEELNANFLVKGFLTPQGNEMEVDIWLIDAASEEVIRSYNRTAETSDILQVRRDISRQVASLFNNNFNPDAGILSTNPDAELAYFAGLDYYWRNEAVEDFSMAINYFERAIQLDPDFFMAYMFLSTTNSWMYHFYYDHTEGRLSKARNALQKATEIEPGNPYNMLAEGYYNYVTHQYEKALELFRRVSVQMSDNFEYNLVAGSLYRRMGNMETALDYYTRANELSPQNKTGVLELAETNLLLRKYDMAEKYFQNYLLIGGQGAGLVNEIDLYLNWEEGTGKSWQALDGRRALYDDSGNIMLVHYGVKLALIDKKYDEALNTLNASGIDSLYGQFFFRPITLYYAEIYLEQGNLEMAGTYYDSARVLLEKNISALPDDYRYYSALGLAYAGLGIKDEAVQEGLKAIELMPVTKDYYRAIFCLEDLARIYTMVGDYKHATETLERLLSTPSLISVNLLKKEPVWEPLWGYSGFIQMIGSHSNNN